MEMTPESASPSTSYSVGAGGPFHCRYVFGVDLFQSVRAELTVLHTMVLSLWSEEDARFEVFGQNNP
jgi:hypothetical protein